MGFFLVVVYGGYLWRIGVDIFDCNDFVYKDYRIIINDFKGLNIFCGSWIMVEKFYNWEK